MVRKVNGSVAGGREALMASRGVVIVSMAMLLYDQWNAIELYGGVERYGGEERRDLDRGWVNEREIMIISKSSSL
jgi:hypothetical protein